MKGIFMIGQDKLEANVLKDIALSLHKEFDSIEIRYVNTKIPLDKDSFIVVSKDEAETFLKSQHGPVKRVEIIEKKDLTNLGKLLEKIKLRILKASK